MTCEELTFRPAAHAAMATNVDSCKSTWTEKRRRRRTGVHQDRLSPPPLPDKSPLKVVPQQQQHHQVISAGMLPTLHALATLSCEMQKRGSCLMPITTSLDPANHMQTTLLEAYCREIGLPLLRLPATTLRHTFPELQDLSCVLVVGYDDPTKFFLESPE